MRTAPKGGALIRSGFQPRKLQDYKENPRGVGEDPIPSHIVSLKINIYNKQTYKLRGDRG